jgi:hypothetical protein
MSFVILTWTLRLFRLILLMEILSSLILGRFFLDLAGTLIRIRSDIEFHLCFVGIKQSGVGRGAHGNAEKVGTEVVFEKVPSRIQWIVTFHVDMMRE